MNEKEFLWWLRGQIRDKFGTLKSYAESKEVSAAYISDIMNGKKNVPDNILLDFNVERRVSYIIGGSNDR